LCFFANERVRRSHAEPCGKKLPAILTPPMKAIIIGLGKNPFPTIAAKIGRRIIVTGVPARIADKNDERTKVINTARKMLSFTTLRSPVEISSDKPKNDKEFERMNKIAKAMMIFHSISFLRSEKLEFFE
jgi:hypothetical protein